ncbi:hypothetical protein KAJ27_17575 [bacterium]|nr:hypothetical protein [bacterium]
MNNKFKLSVIILLAIVLGFIAFNYRYVSKKNKLLKNKHQAFFIAQRELEKLKHWNSINLNSLKDLSILLKNEFVKEKNTYRVLKPKIDKNRLFSFWRVIDIGVKKQLANGIVIGNMCLIMVTVDWKETDGTKHSFSLNEYIEKKKN